MSKEILRKAKEEKGITLIALVITIIVLLILAGITLSMVLGPNGIIERAKEAKEQTEGAALNEQLMLNEVDRYLEEQLGNKEPEDKTALKIVVNSGTDGIVVLPIDASKCDLEGGYNINWGDGTTGKQQASATVKAQLASKDTLSKIHIAASTNPDGLEHTYTEKNKEYAVTITGNCSLLTSSCGNVMRDKIIEIAQWGETGLQKIHLSGCTNLRKIASPSQNSFTRVTDFNYTFENCISLTSIPADLFNNCSEITDFGGTFAGCSSLTDIPASLFSNCLKARIFSETFIACTSLTSIPANLFANCQEVTSFSNTFDSCTSLRGDPIKLWEEGRDGITQTSGGFGCYYNCTNLNRYSEIPLHWRNYQD